MKPNQINEQEARHAMGLFVALVVGVLFMCALYSVVMAVVS